MEVRLKYDEYVKWIEKYSEGDHSYPYHCINWFREEKAKRPLNATESKVFLWLERQYGLDNRE